MLGLGVLHTTSAAGHSEWAAIPERDRAACLREAYWAQYAEKEPSKAGRAGPFIHARMGWHVDRPAMGRSADDPGDSFVHFVNFPDLDGSQFEWIEVTEVFTTVPAREVNDAMRALHGFRGKRQADLDAFRNNLPMGRPSRAAQRRAADRVIQQVKRKLAKPSYLDLAQRYGRGVLVVGMPLWFATRPDDPGRPHNAIDDFMTRTGLGLQEIERGQLANRRCPFRKVIVVWEPSSQAVREWEERGGPAAYRKLLRLPPHALLESGLSEDEDWAPSAASFTLTAEAKGGLRTTLDGTGPFPERVESVERMVHKAPTAAPRAIAQAAKFVSWLAMRRLELLRLWKQRGEKALLPLLVGRLLVSRKVRAVQRRARRLHRASVRRGRFAT